jgi:PBP1b-binding outer membrane lipoprotein LpoB
MKKIVCLTGLILLVALLLCGCADQQPQQKTDIVHPEETATEVSTESGTGESSTVESGTALPDQQNTTGNVSSVTQEELDKLKADIEGLEAEDLGGLSSE